MYVHPRALPAVFFSLSPREILAVYKGVATTGNQKQIQMLISTRPCAQDCCRSLHLVVVQLYSEGAL